MTELAMRTNGFGLVEHPEPAPPAPVVARLTDWAAEARAAAAIATSLCKTSFVPEHFRNKPEEATAAILTGHEMGLSPMAALRAIYVIKGTPAMYAHAMRAVVQSQGHEIWVKEATATRAIVCGRRRHSSEVQQSVWTIDRAKRAGLLGNQQYTKNPQNMLTARATAEICRLVASDALHGIPYAVEELDDDQAADTALVAEVKPARRTARRAQAPRQAPPAPPEPELEEPAVEPSPQPEPAVEAAVDVDAAEPPITEAQIKRLHVAFGDAGIKERAQKIALIEQVTGRVVASSKELTRREAARVIDHLEAPPSAVEEPPAVEEPGFDDDWPETATPGGEA